MTEQEEFEFRLRLEREAAQEGVGAKVKQQAGNLASGLLRGAVSLGATLRTPVTSTRADGTQDTRSFTQKRGDIIKRYADAEGALLAPDRDSLSYRGGKLTSEVLGTLGVGGGLANVLRGVGAPAALTQAVGTSGMAGGSMPARMAGGALSGAASAGLVSPEEVGTGAAIGAALPPVARLGGMVGNAVGSAARKAIPAASPEVAALADKAAGLGIPIPADRLVNSRPLNAIAASLEYVPLSGRAASVEAMTDGLNRAVSRTVGQNTDNVTQALRAAGSDLGGKFDAVLRANAVQITPGFKQALAEAEDRATAELGAEAAGIIHKQIRDILSKGAAGQIDGQTAYNIKKTLDRIGSRNTPEAFYARDLRRALMDALNESLGPQAPGFAELRRQYGNMLALENLAQNGAEGGISVARLANMRNINNPELQDLADIAAQFMRTRESPHGALQRLVIGGAATGVAGGAGMLGALPLAAGAGRGANALLNSTSARNMALGRNNAVAELISPEAQQLMYRAAPVAFSDR